LAKEEEFRSGFTISEDLERRSDSTGESNTKVKRFIKQSL
jgi:hypothetical protein